MTVRASDHGGPEQSNCSWKMRGLMTSGTHRRYGCFHKTCSGSKQKQSSDSTEGPGAHEPAPLAEELLAVHGSWGGEGSAFVKV